MGFLDTLKRLLAGPRRVTAMDARQLLQERKDVIILDVRQAGEYRSGHLPGAKHVPVGLVAQRAERMDPNATYLVYCRSGARSSRAARALAARGFQDVRNLHGGILAWQALGYPVRK